MKDNNCIIIAETHVETSSTWSLSIEKSLIDFRDESNELVDNTYIHIYIYTYIHIYNKFPNF